MFKLGNRLECPHPENLNWRFRPKGDIQTAPKTNPADACLF